MKYNSVKTVSAMFEPPGGEANDSAKYQYQKQKFKTYTEFR
jgi:hypothetical protein